MWYTRRVADENTFAGAQLIFNAPPGDCSSITQELHFLSRGDTCYYYLGCRCICFHRLDDRVERNLWLARLAQMGHASASQLAAVHQISARTVKRAQQRLEEGGPAAFFNTPPRPGRPLAIQDPQLLARAAELLLGGTSLRSTARQLGINYQTLRNYKRAGRLPGLPPDQDQPEPNGDLEPGEALPSQNSDPGQPAPAEPSAGAAPGDAPPRNSDPGRPGPELSADATPEEALPSQNSDPGQPAPAEPSAGATPGDAPPRNSDPGRLGPARPLDKQQRNLRDAAAPQGRATCDSQGRALASMGQALTERLPSFPQALTTVTWGGLLVALPALLQQGLLSCAGPLSLPQGFYGLRSVLLTVAFMLLSGTKNPERLGYLPPGELGALLGLDRGPATSTLRRRLRLLAADECALASWRDQLAQLWASDCPTDTLYVDGHVLSYCGQGRLPKHFVARDKLKLPGAASCWVSAPGGVPLLCLHGDLNTSLAQEIRQLVLPQLEQLDLLNEPVGRPSQGAEPRLTLVFDRGGWSFQLFEQLDRLGVAFITWRKGPQTERWPQSEFKQLTYAVATPLGERSVKARAAERRVPLREKDAKQVAQDAKKVAQADPAPPTDRLDTVRELRFFDESRLPMPSRNGPARKAQACASPAQHQRQPALITNHVSLAAEDVLGRLRARWAQENSFKFMRQHFALDTLPEHRLTALDPATRVVHPIWRQADNLARRLKTRCGQLTVRLKRCSDRLTQQQADEQRAKLQQQTDEQRTKRQQQADELRAKLQQQADELRAEIQQFETALDGAEQVRRGTPHYVLAGELPEQLRYQALPKPLRYLMDTLRMLVYRTQLSLAAAIAPQLAQPEQAHALVRQSLLSAEASLQPDHQAGILRVRLLHQSRQAWDAAVQPLLTALNQTRTLYPGTQLRLVYEFVSAPASGEPAAARPAAA